MVKFVRKTLLWIAERRNDKFDIEMLTEYFVKNAHFYFYRCYAISYISNVNYYLKKKKILSSSKLVEKKNEKLVFIICYVPKFGEL